MLCKRIIPCLDVDLGVPEGRVVKGIRFKNLAYAGNPWELAKRYEKQGADELVFLDITASADRRATMAEVIERTAEEVFIPLTVGGGIRTKEDVKKILRAGADKISVNTAAIENKGLIKECSETFGAQCTVVAIDAKKERNSWACYSHGGRKATGLDAVGWAKEAENLGAGELLITSMDRDGTKIGYDLELTRAIAGAVNIPVIASGGVGAKKHFLEAFEAGADAALAASVFHFGEMKVREVKEYLKNKKVAVRL